MQILILEKNINFGSLNLNYILTHFFMFSLHIMILLLNSKLDMNICIIWTLITFTFDYLNMASSFRAPRDHVIQLVRNCRETVSLVVCQPPLDNVSKSMNQFDLSACFPPHKGIVSNFILFNQVGISFSKRETMFGENYLARSQLINFGKRPGFLLSRQTFHESRCNKK